MPAALWLAVMSRPVIALLYEHGRFHASDTGRTAGALIIVTGAVLVIKPV